MKTVCAMADVFDAQDGGDEDKPDGFDEFRDMPLTLGRLLWVMRERHPVRSRNMVGAYFGLTEQTIGNWERAQGVESFSYIDLECYQDLYGLPTGVMLSVAHLAALSRDAALAEDGKETTAIDRARALAHMLHALADRVLEPGVRAPLWRLEGNRENYHLWDRILTDLIETLKQNVPNLYAATKLFENRQRLRRRRDMRPQSAKRRKSKAKA